MLHSIEFQGKQNCCQTQNLKSSQEKQREVSMETKRFYPNRNIFNNSMRNEASWKYISVGKIFPSLFIYIFPVLFSPIVLLVYVKINIFLRASRKKKFTNHEGMKAMWEPQLDIK